MRFFHSVSYFKPLILGFALTLLACFQGQAEPSTADATGKYSSRTWSLQDGSRFEASFTIELGSKVYFQGEEGRNWIIPLHYLGDEEQQWVQAHLGKGKEPVLWRDSTSPMAKAVRENSLILGEDGNLEDFEVGNRMEPEFYVFYTGASWCGPCRSFVKHLKIWYDEFKRHGISNTEVFFVSSDNSRGEFKKYVTSHDMKWPAISWKRNYPKAIQQYRRNSIPGMVITDRQGRILTDAHSGTDYRGAHTVLEELKEMVFHTNPQNPLTYQVYFDTIRNRYLENNKGKDLLPSPLYLFVDPETQKQWGSIELDLILKVSRNGHVIDCQILNHDRHELESSIRQACERWLFLPQLKEGRPMETQVRLPLKIHN